MVAVRFDDLTPGRGRSFGFAEPVDKIIAHTVADVPRAIQAVADASAAGLWAAGFIAYEAAPAFDPALTVRDRPSDDSFSALPLVWFATFRDRLAIEAPGSGRGHIPYTLSSWDSEVDAEVHQRGVERIRESIAAGDTYQANYTFRLRSRFEGDDQAFYADLVAAQRGAFGAYLDTGRFQILSASPEQFFGAKDGRIRVRPMKGTIRRGRSTGEDLALARELEFSEKDRAENLMIVDLLRNDVGRISVFGSVEVTEMFTVERYDTLWQMTSSIEADLQSDVGLPQILKALFPSGSITGAPKASTMRILAGLETTPRGVYCGAIGYVEPYSASTQFNVAIRTVVIDRETAIAEYGTGSGITWGSTPAGEFSESMLKTEMLAAAPDRFELLETLRYQAGEYLLLERHLDRILGSAGYFGFAHSEDALRRALADHAGGLDGTPARVRLLLDRTGAITVETAEKDLEAFVAGPDDPGFAAPPLSISIAPVAVDGESKTLYHKTTARDFYEVARAAAPDADDVLLVNGAGEVTESTIANLAIRNGSRWYTPPVESGCLPGVYRAELIAEGILTVSEVPVDSLATADEVALINSVRGWRRAELIDSDSGTAAGSP